MARQVLDYHFFYANEYVPDKKRLEMILKKILTNRTIYRTKS